MTKQSHNTVRQSMQERIETGEWALGGLIPGEIELAEEYGCARTTINRALQALADAGMLVRKRKGGTRVCNMPVRQAKFSIPVVREQVEAMGSQYRHRVLVNTKTTPPTSIATRLNISDSDKALYIETVHLADDRPFAFESRWINLKAVPNIVDAPFKDISVNEWLIRSVPFSNGDVIFSAINADEKIADCIEAESGTAVFVVDRTTWYKEEYITTLKLYYKPGFQLYTRF